MFLLLRISARSIEWWTGTSPMGGSIFFCEPSAGNQLESGVNRNTFGLFGGLWTLGGEGAVEHRGMFGKLDADATRFPERRLALCVSAR